MTDKNKALDISIMGRTYKVSCADEEREALLRAVAYLDQKMNEIKSGGRVGSAERIAVMAALNIAHELLEARAPRASAASPDGFDMAEAKRRMAVMQATLEQALAPQEKLL
ncbi:MAG: cell division protein ZapA [Burkholderiales bacterium]